MNSLFRKPIALAAIIVVAGVASVSAAPPPNFFGTGTKASLAAIGIPIYPAIRPERAHIVRSTSAGITTTSVVATVTDSFKAVDDWYASKLDAGFKAHRLSQKGMSFSEYVKGVAPSSSSVLVQGAKINGKASVAIQISVQKPS